MEVEQIVRLIHAISNYTYASGARKKEEEQMFRTGESNTSVLENLERSARVAERFSRQPDKPAEYLGLCRNCDVRETCQYRRPGSIVWYCEEYR